MVFWVVASIVIFILCAASGTDDSFLSTNLYRYGMLALCLVLALLNVKKTANEELVQAQIRRNTPPQYTTYTSQTSSPKRKKKKSLLFGAMKSMNNAVNNNIDGFANGVGSAFMGSGRTDNPSYQEQQRKANKAAWDRWHAQDMQKKAEWDARDAALRGKDKAAWQRKNDADYWRNQSRR